MKYIDEVDLELVNQELNFHSPDNNLVIKGGCELFTTKPIGSDRKLFKTIDKHLDQIIEDNQFSRSVEQDRRDSISSIFGSSSTSSPDLRRHSGVSLSDMARRSSANLSSTITFGKNSLPKNGAVASGSYSNGNTSLLSESLHEGVSVDDSNEHAIDESPFGPLKNVTTRKTFAYLIAILNSSFPDQDFTNLQPTTENFYRIDSADDLVHRFNNVLLSLGKKEDILNWIWDIINSYMDVLLSKNSSPYIPAQSGGISTGTGPIRSRHGSFSSNNNSPPSNSSLEPCQIYQFQPSDESILEDLTYPYQPMWSYYYFIYNKKKKRVTFIHIAAINKAHYSNVNASQSSENSKDPSKSARVINHGDEEEYDENDDYGSNDIDQVVEDDDDDEDDDVVGDLEI
ncbi:Repressor of RNA polymerase III transcription MAF1 [Candida viswanathii]|uniref:Repressor of RNA polymerase III transcription MAF1 n=1 Tax=Candida viswanathii TaxID=5486 RepID=A0A367YN82_9ASCO|nr:Repressor of RNA polymerase III transcription MAF1 [Candida viswanathii]